MFGILRGYRIRFRPVGDEDFNTTELILVERTSYNLTNLFEAVNYSIGVAAVTVGDGVYSDPIYVMTDEDGKLHCPCHETITKHVCQGCI